MALALVVLVRARRGTFLMCPHGPVVRNKESEIRSQELEEILKVFIEFLKNIAKQENASFIRISSLAANFEDSRAVFKNLGFRRAPIHMHPELAWMLDITKPAETILREMRKQTRHCIKNAEKLGVSIQQSDDVRDIDKFYAIYEVTVARHDFVPFSKEYLKKEFAMFVKDKQAALFLGIYQNEVISGAIVIFANGSGFYHHGASNPKFSKVPAAHLLQWEVILEAKRRGFLLYNFWGVAPDGSSKHPWAGPSLFKKGFGGFSEGYMPAQDLALKPAYWITYCVEKVRRWKRGL